MKENFGNNLIKDPISIFHPIININFNYSFGIWEETDLRWYSLHSLQYKSNSTDIKLVLSTTWLEIRFSTSHDVK